MVVEEEPPTPREIADACMEVIDDRSVCDEIAAQPTLEEAYRLGRPCLGTASSLSLTISALDDYIEGSEAFLAEKGIAI